VNVARPTIDFDLRLGEEKSRGVGENILGAFGTGYASGRETKTLARIIIASRAF
jgi:hypothetical protein